MVKRHFVCLTLIVLFLVDINLVFSLPSQADSRACNAITKGCVSNVTNELTVKDEELLQACKDCCSISQTHVPGSVKSAFKGCTPRCKKSCEVAYKKAVAKSNKS